MGIKDISFTTDARQIWVSYVNGRFTLENKMPYGPHI